MHSARVSSVQSYCLPIVSLARPSSVSWTIQTTFRNVCAEVLCSDHVLWFPLPYSGYQFSVCVWYCCTVCCYKRVRKESTDSWSDVCVWLIAASLPSEASRTRYRHLMLARLLQRQERRLKTFWGRTATRLIQEWALLSDVTSFFKLLTY